MNNNLITFLFKINSILSHLSNKEGLTLYDRIILFHKSKLTATCFIWFLALKIVFT